MDQLEKVKVEITTLAKPSGADLLHVRQFVDSDPETQAVFQLARANKLSSDELADAIWVVLDAASKKDLIQVEGDLWDVCLYLADEFTQAGDSLLVVSTITGRAIAKVSDEDLYQPPDVYRSSGNLATPLPRIKPEIEAAIIQKEHDKCRDKDLLSKMARKLLLAKKNDPRLLRITKNGRSVIANQIKEDLPNLWGQQRGVSGQFLSYCEHVSESEVPKGLKKWQGDIRAKVIIPVMDPTTSNIRFDPKTNIKTQLGSQWVRKVAWAVTELTSVQHPDLLSVEDTLPEGLWVCDPSTASALQYGKTALAIPEVATSVLISEGAIVYLCVDEETYDCQSREFLDRWEVAAGFKIKIYVSEVGFTPYQFIDSPSDEFRAEVVS